jgi:hypothetical protein
MAQKEEVLVSLAGRLRRNLLSADEFETEMRALTRGDRAALVEYLARMEKGPFEYNADHRAKREPQRSKTTV